MSLIPGKLYKVYSGQGIGLIVLPIFSIVMFIKEKPYWNGYQLLFLNTNKKVVHVPKQYYDYNSFKLIENTT